MSTASKWNRKQLDNWLIKSRELATSTAQQQPQQQTWRDYGSLRVGSFQAETTQQQQPVWLGAISVSATQTRAANALSLPLDSNVQQPQQQQQQNYGGTADVQFSMSVIGPGMWASVHALGYASRSADFERKQCMASGIRAIFENLPCEECSKHSKQMLIQSPPENSICESRPDGLWEWTVARHNEVNRRMGKAEISLSAATKAWSSKCESCSLS